MRTMPVYKDFDVLVILLNLFLAVVYINIFQLLYYYIKLEFI